MDIFNQIFNVDCYKDYQNVRGIQNIYTPIDKIEKVSGFDFNSVIDASTKEIGVLFNFEFIENILKKVNKDYINNIHITFFYDSNFDLNEAKFIAACNNFNNITFESIKDFSDSKNIKDLDKVMANKKFDIVFSNPPYNDGLDLKILIENKFAFDEAVIIHPGMWFFDNKNIQVKFKKFKETFSFKKIVTFWGNKLFNINLFMPIVISYITTKSYNEKIKIIDNAFTHEVYEIESINDGTIYGKNITNVSRFIESIKHFMKSHNGSILKNIFNSTKLRKNVVKFACIRGHVDNKNETILDDFWTMLCQDIKKNMPAESEIDFDNYKPACFLMWTFETDIERMNFINYCKTKIARFCLSYYKINSQLTRGETELIPWLDFTQEWDDAKLCKEFGISEELWNYINNFIPDYYEDYESGFKSKTY